MLGASGIRDRLDDGSLVIEPFDEDRLHPLGYDLAASADVYRLGELDRPINPLNAATVSEAVVEESHSAGEIVVQPDEPVTILSRERIAVDPSLAVIPSTHPSLRKLGIAVRADPDGIRAPDASDAPDRIACTVVSSNPTPVILHENQPIARLRFIPVDGRSKEADRSDAAAPVPNFEELASTVVSDGLCIGVTGLAATGKSVAAEMLADLLDATSYSMGQVIRDEAARRGLEQTGENLNRVSESIREEHGDAVVAERLIEDLQAPNSAGVRIIEGIRGPAEVATFREELSDAFFLLGVHASASTRTDRIERRGRSDDAGGATTLATRDEKESGFGVREALGMADHIITNEGSLADLQRDVERVASLLLHRYG